MIYSRLITDVQIIILRRLTIRSQNAATAGITSEDVDFPFQGPMPLSLAPPTGRL